MSGFDLNASKDVATREDAGTVVHLRDESGEYLYEGDKPVTIKVAGSYSRTFRRAQDVQREKMLNSRRVKLTGEALARQQVELVAACVLAWGGITASGEPLPCNRENAIAVFTAAPWVREQVEEAMNDHASFLPGVAG